MKYHLSKKRYSTTFGVDPNFWIWLENAGRKSHEFPQIEGR